MNFYQEYQQYSNLDFENFLGSVTERDIARILSKDNLTVLDFLSLLSPAAQNSIEAMAQKANRLTLQHFGKAIILYTPIYLSNYCTNQCVYCGFDTRNALVRKQLSLQEVELEAQTVSATGLEHVLLLTGDAPGIATMDYLVECTKVMRRYFASIGMEIYALSEEEYTRLGEEGIDLLTIYQETYNVDLYKQLHLKGPKRDYYFRLDAPERACKAGIRSVNVGALLGLDDWRKDTFYTALHANYLQTKYASTEVSVSLPRLRPHVGHNYQKHLISDRNFVQCVLAYRLFMPRLGITISTRENSAFRDNIIRLGVTKMSAGSCTAVGGHTLEQGGTGQFDIADTRTVDEMRNAVQRAGYQAVLKDWQRV